MFAFVRFLKAPGRLFARGALALTLAAVLPASGAMAAAILSVTIDQAKIARVPEGTKTLVIGSPIIADVTLLKGSNTMVVTGKGYGETNLIALDGVGNVLDEKMVRVEPTSSVLVVQRGALRESYSCTPKCMPVVQLGDSADFGSEVPAADQIKKRNDLAAPSATSQQSH
jgi:Flp pilus assembly secretin CpaC